MTRPVNIYALSRVKNKYGFNAVKNHRAGGGDKRKTQSHEMKSLRLLSDALVSFGALPSEMDFYFGYSIQRIGKEFDLLRITKERCVNIELKSTAVPKAR